MPDPKKSPKVPKMAVFWGRAKWSILAIFECLTRLSNQMAIKSRKFPLNSFKWLNVILWSILEGENKEFRQSCLLTGMQEPVVTQKDGLGLTKNCHSTWEVLLTKVLVFYRYGGSKWYINHSYGCSNTCIRVIRASFDPPPEIASVGEIF